MVNWQNTPNSSVQCTPFSIWLLLLSSRGRTYFPHMDVGWLFDTLEKEMATHSSVHAWRIPGMGEPGGLPSMGSHRVRHDWSDLAAEAAKRMPWNWCLFRSKPRTQAFHALVLPPRPLTAIRTGQASLLNKGHHLSQGLPRAASFQTTEELSANTWVSQGAQSSPVQDGRMVQGTWKFRGKVHCCLKPPVSNFQSVINGHLGSPSLFSVQLQG